MKKLNWAILGPGLIATEFAQALLNVHGEIYAVGSRTLEKAEAFAKKYQVQKAYGSYDELLADSNVDVVYISTPHCNHYEYIMKSLHQNKHVLCEKAITVSSSELKEITELAATKNLVVSEAMTIYHMPLYEKLKQVVQTGKLGTLKMVNVSFGSCKEYDVTNRFFSPDLAGGALLDIGTYALSFARFFLSAQPHEVLTTVKKFETGVDEQSGIILKNDADEMAVVTLTMRAKMPKRGVVAGDLGFITVDNFPRATRAMITYLDGTTEVVEAGVEAKALEYEILDMENYILNNGGDDVLQLSVDVMDIMTDVRNQWGIKYPFEK
ncbi:MULTISPECIES: Gfo/Idh/MocA family protein [Turicibacter]|jgi:oxidoreductase, NAD-binding domain protein|uniref:Gfo/Idh/MocA family oxidoreductase n=4 Tax=Bacteria TaxID=2 RepID=A0A173T981_9FIRM|nr:MULTISPECIES: Gfo/Idh/MocA family oxidoreductase [Turicibacter]EFF64494.1 oxidoreductase, NAD-binding domain protein [Turicibacter sanguinis PC909]EGC91824.1 oxidoreductase, NAD-binding domain protein [Turicibacter sp. HGF1]MBP3902960.1 Gfo/Idh/MocA family oxidoreductase [Turicibacter sp.]MCU7190912.1 Gfo/Idh/MocA family oxidoreductase [Turicibacter sanguinis]MCU7195684.1 Gfo/Idh/MocA family oxidoreductase [Turicibacter sanguinis]